VSRLCCCLCSVFSQGQVLICTCINTVTCIVCKCECVRKWNDIVWNGKSFGTTVYPCHWVTHCLVFWYCYMFLWLNGNVITICKTALSEDRSWHHVFLVTEWHIIWQCDMVTFLWLNHEIHLFMFKGTAIELDHSCK